MEWNWDKIKKKKNTRFQWAMLDNLLLYALFGWLTISGVQTLWLRFLLKSWCTWSTSSPDVEEDHTKKPWWAKPYLLIRLPPLISLCFVTSLMCNPGGFFKVSQMKQPKYMFLWQLLYLLPVVCRHFPLFSVTRCGRLEATVIWGE